MTILPNRTTLVTPFEIEEFPKYISALDLIQRAVTRLAALYRTESDLARIRKADDTYKGLHMAIAHAANNAYFIGYYERLLGEGQRLLHLRFDYTVSSPSTTKPGRDHADIIDAIAR
ncbi:GntR family transcriptional regulator [Caballeronia catudaia]|uniref:hypothetical protein n=1 Tax=Caballeronia catudaia TaxID=1777136 RepID=UPI001F20A1C9|nr:hypothetical protein [Caballeronia catudaia]